MAKAGFGKPSADDLIAMKVQGVTPEYVSELRAAGLQPGSIGDLISYRIFGVTPEFLAGMKAAGFDSIPPKKLIALRVHGVTPEYARTVKQQYPNATIDELVQLRIFHIDDAFLAAAKRHGFTSLSIQKLVQLRISGVLGDERHGGEMTSTGGVILDRIPGSIHRLVLQAEEHLRTLSGSCSVAATSNDAEVDFRLERGGCEGKEDCGSTQTQEPLSAFFGFTLADLRREGAHVDAVLRAEAGTITCSGAVHDGRLSGAFRFVPDPAFVDSHAADGIPRS